MGKIAAKKGFSNIFRTMRSRNYRLFFFGQGISLTGTWMQTVAQSWLVYRLTSSELLLGVVGFLGLFPIFIFSPFAGVLADRVHRHSTMIVTQSLAMTQALILAILVLTGRVQVAHIMVLAGFMGIINAFDMPVRQAFTIDMIENKEDLSNAIALNSAMFNGARLIGPSIAGLLIATLGEGLCFLINAISYLAVIAALMLMKINKPEKKKQEQNILSGLKEGVVYAFGFAPIRAILLLTILISISGMPYMVLMPIFARDILHGGANLMGFLMGAAGSGALIGAIFLAARKNAAGLEKVIPAAAAVFGGGLVFFALSSQTWLSMVLLLFTGLGMMVSMASANTMIQTIVDEDKRGRVLSFFVMCFMGTAPFGSLISGAAAHRIGAPNTVLIGGICCILAALAFFLKLKNLKKFIDPIYAGKGFISEKPAD